MEAHHSPTRRKADGAKESRESTLKDISKMGPRDQLVMELLETEKQHVATLEGFVQHYLQPLRERSAGENAVLSGGELQTMVSNLELIYSWNQQFYRALRKRLKKRLDKPFGDILVHMTPMLRQLYTQYNENYESALKCYEWHKSKNKAFNAFLAERYSASSKDFLTYLYLPIQRMIAYDSLVKDILSHTPRTHDNTDFRNLTKALHALRAITQHADERVLQRKNMDHVLAIQEMLGDDGMPPLSVPHRRYVFEGSVRLVSVDRSQSGARSARRQAARADGEGGREAADGSKEMITVVAGERYLFLFNDMLLCCKYGKKSLSNPHKMYSVDFIIGDMQHVVAVDEEESDDPYCFRLSTPASQYVFSSQEKSAWLQLIPDVVQKLENTRKGILNFSQTMFEKSEPISDIEVTKELLLQHILRWSRMSDAEAVLMEIKEFAAPFAPAEDDAEWVLDEEEEQTGVDGGNANDSGGGGGGGADAEK